MVTPATRVTPNEDVALASPGWRLRSAVVADLHTLTDVRDWKPTFDHDRDLLTATARGAQGAYTLALFQGESSLILARDAADVDLSTILTKEDVGMKIQEVATSLRSAFLEQKRVLEQLPQMAQRPVRFTGAPECWRASSGAGQAYLYYQDGPTSIQVSCLPGCENPPGYTVKIQSAPDVPWVDMTERVRGSAVMDRTVRQLLNAPIL
jgi:hypothetical protein